MLKNAGTSVVCILIGMAVMLLILGLDKVSFGCGADWVCLRNGQAVSDADWSMMVGVSIVFGLFVGVPIAAVIAANRNSRSNRKK